MHGLIFDLSEFCILIYFTVVEINISNQIRLFKHNTKLHPTRKGSKNGKIAIQVTFGCYNDQVCIFLTCTNHLLICRSTVLLFPLLKE